MAKLIYFGIFLAVVASHGLPGSRPSMEEMMDTFKEIEFPNAVSLTSQNFQSALSNNSNPWFIFFSEPRSFQSVIKNPVWLIFGSHAKEKGLEINLGVIDMSKEFDLKKRFKITSYPVFLYIDAGHYYNYSGPSEPEDFEKVVEQKLHVQYDRQPFELTPHDANWIQSFRREFLKNPAVFITGTFISSLIGLTSFGCACCRNKNKKPSKTEETKSSEPVTPKKVGQK